MDAEAFKPGDRVQLSVMGGGLGTVLEIGVRWQGRGNAVKIKRDGAMDDDALLYWPRELTLAAVAPPTPAPEPTATWWARRWFNSASPAERQAMRDIIDKEGIGA